MLACTVLYLRKNAFGKKGFLWTPDKLFQGLCPVTYELKKYSQSPLPIFRKKNAVYYPLEIQKIYLKKNIEELAGCLADFFSLHCTYCTVYENRKV